MTPPDTTSSYITAPNILLVEDDPEIRRFVTAALTEAQWVVHESATMARGLIDAGTRRPDVIVLDLGLPDGDGMALITDVRGWTQIPILVLSARASEKDKINALGAGADDYLTKPFGVGELIARVKVLLRRSARSAHDETAIVHFGDVTVDLSKRLVMRGAQQVNLTATEYRLLAALLAQRGKVLTHSDLLKQVWGPSHADDHHYLRIYMGHLRHKLEADPAQPVYLKTEIGVGYRFFG
ncbi:MAG: response regulator [Comamonadaceae bacterium]|nr:MAG: response regulator [Comamonadaceae bacterium]